MREILEQLSESIAAGRAVAYCRLVETRGSTPQKAGATMLVFADGSQAGTLGGGCVEAEVKRKALAAMQNGVAEIAKFNLDSDYGWDDGLICGGRMLVLIEPLAAGALPEYFSKLIEMMRAGAPLTEAIVFDAEASGLPAAAKFLFDEQDRVVAWASDPSSAASGRSMPLPLGSEIPATAALQPLDARPRPYAAKGISYLPVFRRCRLVVVGGGHVGQAVANLAADLDFEVWVTDDRDDIISVERFPKATRRIAGPVEQVLPALEITPDTYCLIVTRGHNHDEEALYYLAERGAAYVGLIGSRRKIKMIYSDLLEQGISPDAIARVHAPVGIDIGSQTVPEIAVSICAELISHRNLNGIIPGRPESISVE
jgi:xanthine dehydrogenase accessory factor